MEDVKGNTQAAIEAGKQLAAKTGEVIMVNDTPVMLVSRDVELKQFPEHRERPVRVEAGIQATSHTAFVDYFNRFKDKNSIIFFDLENHKIKGVLDYHETGDNEAANAANLPRHGKHTVTYDCPLTPEAKHWLEGNSKHMDQFLFAQFIETGMLEIVDPVAATMLEIASSLQAKSNVNFRSGLRLDNGAVNLSYQEDVQGSAGVDGNLQIPQKIVLNICLFRGDTVAYRIEANFRYRVAGGKLALWYELVRPHAALEDAVTAIAGKIKTGVGETSLFESKL